MSNPSGRVRNLVRTLPMEERINQVSGLYLRGKTQAQIAETLAISQGTVSKDLRKIRAQWLKSSVRNFDEAKAEELAKIDHIEKTCWEAWDRSCKDAETLHKKTEQVLRMLAPDPEASGGEEGGNGNGNRKGRGAKGKGGKGKGKLGDKVPPFDGRKYGKVPPAPDGVGREPVMVPVKVIEELTRKGQAGDPRWMERIAWCVETRLKILGVFEEPKDGGGDKTPVIINWESLYLRRPAGPPVSDPIEERIAREIAAGRGDPSQSRPEDVVIDSPPSEALPALPSPDSNPPSGSGGMVYDGGVFRPG